MTVLFPGREKRRLRGTEMKFLFLKMVKRRLPGTEMTVLFLKRVKREAARNRNGVFVPEEDGQEEDGSKKGDSDPDDGEKLAVAGEKAEVRGGGD